MSRVPEIPTLVFAGTLRQRIEPLRRANVDAYMVSWNDLEKDKKFKATIEVRHDGDWRPLRYLDSGVFTFMQRAGLKGIKTANTDSSWESFLVLARSYIAYLKDHADLWDWIIELDVEELYGVEAADHFRRRLREVVGDRLFPVWHVQRGESGWQEMIREFPYVCISTSNALGSTNIRARRQVREMIYQAHAAGVKVHFLGCSSIGIWSEYGVDTMDSSSWTYGPRVGHFYVGKGQPIVLPRGSRGKEVNHARLMDLRDKIAPWGFTLEEARTNQHAGIEIGARLLLAVQEEIRARQFTQTVI